MQRLSALLPALLLTVALLAASASAASFDDTSAVLVGGSLAVFASSSSSNGTTLSNGTAASNGTLPVGELGSDGGGGVLRYVWVTCEPRRAAAAPSPPLTRRASDADLLWLRAGFVQTAFSSACRFSCAASA